MRDEITKKVEHFREQTRELKPWAFFDDLLYLFYKNKDFGIIELELDGGRKSGKTYAATDLCAKAVLMLKNNIDIYLMRWLKSDTNELKEEIQDRIEQIIKQDLNKKILNKSLKHIKINNNNVRILGIHTPSNRKKVSLTGLKRATDRKYSIIILEEAYEFTDKEVAQIKQAIGGYRNYLFINITNPNSLAYPLIARREKEFPHKLNELQNKGYQFKVVKIAQNHTKIYMYSNWRINKYLSVPDIKFILSSHTLDPQKAIVVDYGMPGVEEGGIYSLEINKIKVLPLEQLIKLPFKSITAGLDWGDGSGENSSATYCAIVAKGYNNERYHLDGYYQHNANKNLSPSQKVKEIILFLKKWVELKPGLLLSGFKINMDTGLYAEKEMLEQLAKKHGLNNLYFDFAYKYQERTRINVRKYLINTGRYYISEHLENLQNELKLQVWDENKKDKQGLPKQKDWQNHTTDAEDYADEEIYNNLQEAEYNLIHKGGR